MVIKFPLIRKIIRIGNSQAVSLPASWIHYYEAHSGRKIKEIAMEVDDVITLRPVLEPKKA